MVKSLTLLIQCTAAILLGLAAGSAVGAETLRVATWDGYADADLVAEFQRRFRVKVEVTIVNSDDDLWEKINRHDGRDYDVFAVNTAELQRYIDAGLSVPLDLGAIPNHARQLPRFRDLNNIPGLIRENKAYAVPYAYSEMGLIYNRKEVKRIPDSMAEMWNPEYRGKVLAFNTSNHNFSIAGLLMGIDNPFHMSEMELSQAAKRLVALRRNVLTFYSTPEEAVKLYNRNHIALVFANYGTQQVKALQEAGADIGYVIPREGAMAWLDCWTITRGARNTKLAQTWINFMLEPHVSERLTRVHGLANTVTPYPSTRPEDKIIWLEPIGHPKTRKDLWDRIMSGEGPDRF
ncbi:putative spermidine/putrescine transport system substrate-binding protein [Novimethylophilus kurashikiensis]|uniref:Putative spermidine/putrescine transport system substrate-binding protein n=1 Tax=Novimethylophilus kurashikiensis TaxID=1825523 RepID=A0A2R5FEH2_9PROT|nr:extracellular solute-binding protein [Novimethylophilus kurashikiensis]GBG15143.1 putative spermidine/putrescine transport system substrate-binding protein [Novimethylophilus kurashikiensis]